MGLRRLPGKNVWVYYTTVNGKYWSRSTGQIKKTLARKEVPRLQELAEACRNSQQTTHDVLSKAIDAEVARVKIDVSENSSARIKTALNNFRKFAGNIQLDKITKDLLEAYQRKRLTKRALGTVDSELVFIRRMLRHNGYHVEKPSPKKGRVTAQRAFTREEIVKFFDVCPARLKPLYLTLLATGGRLAELTVSPYGKSTHTPLLKTEVDLEQRVIRLRPAKQREGREKVAPKVRLIPLPAWVIEPLREHMARTKGPHVFPAIVNSVSRNFDLICQKAGIPKFDALKQKVTAHSFRHTYATLLSELLGNNPFMLKEALGHKRITTTERYCHPTTPSLEIALPELNGVAQPVAQPGDQGASKEHEG